MIHVVNPLNRFPFTEGSVLTSCTQKLRDLVDAIKRVIIRFFQCILPCFFRKKEKVLETQKTGLNSQGGVLPPQVKEPQKVKVPAQTDPVQKEQPAPEALREEKQEKKQEQPQVQLEPPKPPPQVNEVPVQEEKREEKQEQPQVQPEPPRPPPQVNKVPVQGENQGQPQPLLDPPKIGVNLLEKGVVQSPKVEEQQPIAQHVETPTQNGIARNKSVKEKLDKLFEKLNASEEKEERGVKAAATVRGTAVLKAEQARAAFCVVHEGLKQLWWVVQKGEEVTPFLLNRILDGSLAWYTDSDSGIPKNGALPYRTIIQDCKAFEQVEFKRRQTPESLANLALALRKIAKNQNSKLLAAILFGGQQEIPKTYGVLIHHKNKKTCHFYLLDPGNQMYPISWSRFTDVYEFTNFLPIKNYSAIPLSMK